MRNSESEERDKVILRLWKRTTECHDAEKGSTHPLWGEQEGRLLTAVCVHPRIGAKKIASEEEDRAREVKSEIFARRNNGYTPCVQPPWSYPHAEPLLSFLYCFRAGYLVIVRASPRPLRSVLRVMSFANRFFHLPPSPNLTCESHRAHFHPLGRLLLPSPSDGGTFLPNLQHFALVTGACVFDLVNSFLEYRYEHLLPYFREPIVARVATILFLRFLGGPRFVEAACACFCY